MKIIHFADIHARDKDIEEIENNLNFLISSANKEKPDLFVIPGDVFDSKNIKMGSVTALKISELFLSLSDIAPIIICLGTDSHDGLVPKILKYIGDGGYSIYVSERPEQIAFYDGDFMSLEEWGKPGNLPPTDLSHLYSPEAIITTCPTPTKKYFQTDSSIEISNQEIGHNLGVMLAGFGVNSNNYIQPSCYKIFMGHFSVSGAKISDTQTMTGRDIEVTTQQLAATNSDVVCLGHIHKAQKMKDNIFYSGSIYRKNYGETEDKGFYIHEKGKESRFIKVPAIKKIVIDYDWTISPEAITDDIMNLSAIEDFNECKIKLNIKLWQDDVHILDKNVIKQYFINEGAFDCIINLIVVPREIVRNKEVNQVEKVSEKIKVLSENRGEEIEEGIIDRIADLESGSDVNELIEKWS